MSYKYKMTIPRKIMFLIFSITGVIILVMNYKVMELYEILGSILLIVLLLFLIFPRVIRKQRNTN